MAEPSGIASLGLDWKQFISQVVNFTILLMILKIFAYKPILSILENRRKVIEKSLERAKNIEKREHELHEQEQLILRGAKQKAEQIITEAKQAAEQTKQQLIRDIEYERFQTKEHLGQEIQLLKEETLREAKRDLAQLVVATSNRVFRKVITKDLHEQILEEVIKEVSI